MLDYNFSFKIDLNTIENLKKFCQEATKLNTDIMVGNLGRTQRVDASSILEVFALDPSQVLLVETNDVEAGNKLKEKVENFIVD